MPRNQKLTRVIAGRSVQRATAEAGKLVINFDDHSIMQVKTARIADMFPPVGKIKAVQQNSVSLIIQFEDGSSLNLRLAEPGSSVAVRDQNNKVEYLG